MRLQGLKRSVEWHLTRKPLTAVEHPILDISYGIKILGNNEGVYKSILREFYKENESVLEMLQSSLADNNYEEAFQIIHKIRGSTGNIGAKELYMAASELQHALTNKNEDEIHKLHTIFEASYERLFIELNRYLQEETS